MATDGDDISRIVDAAADVLANWPEHDSDRLRSHREYCRLVCPNREALRDLARRIGRTLRVEHDGHSTQRQVHAEPAVFWATMCQCDQCSGDARRELGAMRAALNEEPVEPKKAKPRRKKQTVDERALALLRSDAENGKLSKPEIAKMLTPPCHPDSLKPNKAPAFHAKWQELQRKFRREPDAGSVERRTKQLPKWGDK